MINKQFLKDINDNKPIIIIHDNEYHQILAKYKSLNYPQANIKLIAYPQAVSMLTFEITDKMISLLMKNDYSYAKTKAILNLLKLLDEKRISSAPAALKECYELIKPLLTKNFDNSIIFKDKSIYLFNKSREVQLKNLFASKGIKINDLNFNDLELEKSKNLKTIYSKDVINFDNKFEQYMYVFSDIRKLLLSKPELNSKLRLIVKDSYDVFYANYFSNLFGIKIYCNLELPLGNEPKIIETMNRLYDSKKPMTTEAILDSTIDCKTLAEIIKNYQLNTFDYQQGYLNLKEIVAQTRYLDNSFEPRGVVITNEFSFDNDLITYVLSFEDGIFYHTYKDNDVITDKQKVELGLNPSYVNTLIDKEKMSCFVKHNNIVLLSRVKQHLNDHIYDSSLIKEDKSLELKLKEFSLAQEKNVNEILTHSFTPAASNVLASALKDRNYDISNFPEVECYDYRTTKINIKPKEKYSISDIQEYSKCPFKYLLDRVYHLNSDDDKYFAHLGTLMHSILEHIQDEHFEFDKLYDRGIDQFKKHMEKSNNGEYDLKYNIFSQIAKLWFKQLCDQYRNRLKELWSHSIKIYPEVKFNFSIPESDYKFDGIIDAVMISSANGIKYYSIIDYKTGNDVFDPFGVCVGQNIQLPFYFFGLRHSDKKDLIKGCEQGGFGLKKELANSIKKLTKDDYFNENTINAYSAISLYANDDPNFKDSLTLYATNEKSKPTTRGVAQLVSIKKNEKSHVKFAINDLVSQAQKAAIDTIERMKRSEYPIFVTAAAGSGNNIICKAYELDKDDTNCKYCKYCDICYKSSIKNSYYDQTQRWAEAWSELILKSTTKGEKENGK